MMKNQIVYVVKRTYKKDGGKVEDLLIALAKKKLLNKAS